MVIERVTLIAAVIEILHNLYVIRYQNLYLLASGGGNPSRQKQVESSVIFVLYLSYLTDTQTLHAPSDVCITFIEAMPVPSRSCLSN